jgi:hypothetical protein
MGLRPAKAHEKRCSADRRFCGPRFFHRHTGKPRTAESAVRATRKSHHEPLIHDFDPTVALGMTAGRVFHQASARPLRHGM